MNTGVKVNCEHSERHELLCCGGQAEIEGRKSHFSNIREHGMNLVNSKHYASEEIQRLIKQLDTTKLSLNGAWDKRYHLLTQCHDLQVCPQPTPLCYQSSQPAPLCYH